MKWKRKRKRKRKTCAILVVKEYIEKLGIH